MKFETSEGTFVILANRGWAPRGADRFHELVQEKFYDEARFFRVLPRFVVQFGIGKDPDENRKWAEMNILDDPVLQSNKRGFVSFASKGANTRTTQIFVNLADNARLDASGFAPFGRVVEGLEVVEKFYSAYGETAPRGSGPDQNKMIAMGNEYVERSFPRLDFVKSARVVAD